MTSKASNRIVRRSSGKKSGKSRTSPTDFAPFGLRLALKHPVRVVLLIALVGAVLAFPLQDWTLETLGWSVVPLGLWAAGTLYLLSRRPTDLIRKWRYILPALLVAVAASGVLGMADADFGSRTGESLGGAFGVAVAIQPAEWDRFNISTADYAIASVRVGLVLLLAAALFAPKLSLRATFKGSRYSWKAAAVTGHAAVEGRRRLKERSERRKAEKLEREAQLESERAAMAAETELAAVETDELEPPAPVIHGIAAESEDEFAAETPPWEDQQEDERGNPMDQELVLRDLPGAAAAATAAGAVPEIVSTALLSQAASQFKWPLPNMDRLKKAPPGGVTRAEIDERSTLIETSLSEYGIDVTVDQVFTGPTVTMYGLKPGWKGRRSEKTAAQRVSVSSILSREKDLALALASPNIRFEPVVPGESVVGIEVPNSKPTPVTLRSVMETPEWKKFQEKAQLPVPLGLGSGGDPVFADLARMPHTLIAGSTGSGKSVCMNAIITGLLMSRSPAETRMVMIDPKRVELTPYSGIPHLYTDVVVEADLAVATLKALIAEMMGRFRILEKAGVKNIVSFNERSKEKMPYLVILVDELADLMLQAANEVERLLVRLAQLGRATGVHLVVATQRPSVDVVTGLIKANFPSRISFAVMSQVDSRTVLDSVGGEKLLGRGDMLYLPIDKAKPERVQGAFLSDTEIEATVRMWKAVKGPTLPELEVELEDAALVDGEIDTSGDSLVDSARNLARSQKTLSTSLLQRRLRIGYPRAARLMDELEDLGVVGPGEPGKPRQVLGA